VLIADSDRAAADLTHYYRIPAERIHVVPLGVEGAFFEITRELAEPYILCVSTLHPHKNIDRLIRVFARFRRHRGEWRLILAGLRGFSTDAIENAVRTHGVEDCVRITGWIPRADLLELYRRAAFFVYPSTFEGFGLPVLEAMAAGVPLACSDIEPLRSTVAGTADLFDPSSDDSILASLERVAAAGTAVGEARRRAAEFTWERCARLTLNAIVSAAGPRAESSRPSSRHGT
jgi:alpha-1,3-rhamnosyl/mannosyltransferase